jgi:transposase
LPGRSEEVAAFAAALPGPVRSSYEAGATGFVLARKLAAVGVECLVCARGLIARGGSDRLKIDGRDAERLVRLLAAGEFTGWRSRALRRRRCAIWSGRGRSCAAI